MADEPSKSDDGVTPRERQAEAGRMRMANLTAGQRRALAKLGGRARAAMGGLRPWDSAAAKVAAAKSAAVRKAKVEERRKAMSLDEAYGRKWYGEHRQYTDEYVALGDALDWMFGPGQGQSVIDVGCGIALPLRRLRALGWTVLGVDGSWNARAESVLDGGSAPVYYADLRVARAPGHEHDLVICLEVAEHIDAEYADALVERLAGYARAAASIVFTAAPPGQGGHGHVNEQPPGYWLERFRRLGFYRDDRRTAVLSSALHLACPRMHWIARNVMVLDETERA